MISDGITCGHAYTIALESTTVAILMREAGRGGQLLQILQQFE